MVGKGKERQSMLELYFKHWCPDTQCFSHCQISPPNIPKTGNATSPILPLPHPYPMLLLFLSLGHISYFPHPFHPPQLASGFFDSCTSRQACMHSQKWENKQTQTYFKKHTWRQNGIPKNTHNTCRRTKKRTTQMYIYAYLCYMQWNTWQQNLVYLVKKAPVRWFCDSACNHSLLEGH